MPQPPCQVLHSVGLLAWYRFGMYLWNESCSRQWNVMRTQRTKSFLDAFHIIILASTSLTSFKQAAKHDLFSGGEKDDER